MTVLFFLCKVLTEKWYKTFICVNIGDVISFVKYNEREMTIGIKYFLCYPIKLIPNSLKVGRTRGGKGLIARNNFTSDKH